MVFGIPDVIGRYTIRGTLGTGGFATVYRAYDPVLDRQVALKVLHPHLSEEPDTRTRFLHEGRTLAGIRHRNIVQVFDAGTADGRVYLAMELVEGRSLASLMREANQIAVAQAVTIAEQAAAALDALHARGLVHCDVKPANILLEQASGRAVLLDFGVSRRVDETVATAPWIWGTPAYMAPEQIEQNGRISHRTDVYQLAATIYALLAAEPPFTGEPAQLMYAVVHRDPPNLAAHRPDVSAQFAAVLGRAMAKDQAQRPDSLGTLVGLLGAETASAPGAVLSESSTQRITTPSPGLPLSPWSAAGGHRPAANSADHTPSPAAMSTERLERGLPASTPASSKPVGRPRTRRTAVIGGVAAALILAVAAGLAWLGYGRDDPDTAPDSEPLLAGVVQTQTQTPTPPPSASPTATPAPSPQASPTRTPTATRPSPSPSSRPPSAAAEGVAGLLQQTMSRRGYTPSGPVVPVSLSRNAVMYVQRGDGDDGQRLFIVVNDTFIGTDWENASPDGVSNARAIGPGRFLVTYAREDGLPVPVVFTWDGDRLMPSSIAPGHCLPTTGC